MCIKRIKYVLLMIMGFALFSISCSDYLDIPPKNVVQDKDLFSSFKGTQIYLARIYSQMPFEDFKYSPRAGFFQDWLVCPGINEGSSIGRDGCFAMTDEGSPLWTNRTFPLLRDINRLLTVLPEYRNNFTEVEYNHLMGEGYFTRAYVYYAMAKRYGGVPLVTEMLNYPERPTDELQIPRASEEETWNQVLADFDQAISLLSPTSPVRGLSNKYVALSFKSEAMLYAACIAKYNSITGFGDKTGVRVIGFDPDRAKDASIKYFKEAYNAAREVVNSGKYSLYRKKWTPNDKEAQFQNMVDMFFDLESPENIYIKEYKYPDAAHGYDSYNIPKQLMGGNGYSSGNCPTLDYVELFDGIEKNEDGTIKVFDSNGKYILYDHITDIFKDVEPRLRAYVIFPGDNFKGQTIEIRRGIFTGDASNGIDPLRTVNGITDYTLSGPRSYTQVDAYTASGSFAGNKSLFLSAGGDNHEVVILPDGSRMNSGGKSGPFTHDRTCALTGFTIRKWLNPNMPQELVLEGRSEQHFILMRYAEVLLNLAEAASELMLAGQIMPDGVNGTDVIYSAIGEIRERAGANPILNSGELSGERGLQLIRKERKKELAFEHKILWDIRRWRTQHSEPLNGSTQQDGAYYRGLYPFYSTQTGKYFFDAGLEEYGYRFRITEQEYYFRIPQGEVDKSPVIDQQPGR